MKRASIYTRVSTLDQTTQNQLLDLRALAQQRGFQIAKGIHRPWHQRNPGPPARAVIGNRDLHNRCYGVLGRLVEFTFEYSSHPPRKSCRFRCVGPDPHPGKVVTFSVCTAFYRCLASCSDRTDC
jgi:hypothetical protein